MKLGEFYPEKQGRPYSPPAIPLDSRGLGISAGAITPSMLATQTKSILSVPSGIYGTSKYGRARYGIRPGIYGVDKYGQVNYN